MEGSGPRTPDAKGVRPFSPRPAEGLNHPNVMRMFEARLARAPGLTALRHHKDGSWQSMTWREWADASRRLARGLISVLGIEPGDRVALMASTRLEWTLLDLAIGYAGAISVPIYPTVAGDEARYILVDSGTRVLVVDEPEQILRLARSEGGLPPQLRAIISVDEWQRSVLERLAGVDGLGRGESASGSVELVSLAAIGEGGAPLAPAGEEAAAATDPAEQAVRDAVAHTELEDVFTIVYTSGTTGQPKGVVLTHKNFVYEAWAIKNTVAVDQTDEQLLILPLAHIFARHMVWAAVESGAITAFGESPGLLEKNLGEVAPSFVGAVPRVYEKIYERIAVAAEATSTWVPGAEREVRRRLFDWALDVGRKASAIRQRGQVLPSALQLRVAVADRLVFEPIRARLGGRLRFFISGAAPLDPELAEFFHAAGVLILEGYGLTETTGATNVNRPDRFRFGTVGPALPGCEVLIAQDGEILIRGHNVMSGYYGQPEATAAIIDPNGWLHTGDVGEISEGFLRITDRKKDIIITAGGKNIAPQKLENRLASREGIEQVMIYGDRRPYLVALITLDERKMMELSEREGLGCRSYAELVQHPRIRRDVQAHVDALNRELASYETIKRFALPPAPFTEASGELTPSLKVKRGAVIARYRDLLESLYEGHAQPRPRP